MTGDAIHSADETGAARPRRRTAAAPDEPPTLEERIDDAVDLSGGTMPIAVVAEDEEIEAARAHLERAGRRGRQVEILGRADYLRLFANQPPACGSYA